MADLQQSAENQEILIAEKEIEIEEKLQARQSIMVNQKKCELEIRKRHSQIETYKESLIDIDKQITQAKSDLESMRKTAKTTKEEEANG